MIYSLIEYCLNCLNGPFYSTPSDMHNDQRYWISLIPFASLYAAFVGINSFVTSFIVVQILCLYHLISVIDYEISQMLVSNDNINPVVKFFIKVLFYPLFYSILISIFLHKIYQIAYKRTISMGGRVSHAISNLILRSIISDKYIFWIVKFITYKILMKIFIRVHFKHKRTSNSVIFAFIGSYYFLRTYSRAIILNWCLPKGLEFDFMWARRHEKMLVLLISYCSLLMLSLISFIIQRLIYEQNSNWPGFTKAKEKCYS